MATGGLFTQPEHLTKDRLKAELKRRGVSFSLSQPKNYYVQLYRERVLTPSAGRASISTRYRSEFSSDEEISKRSQQYVTPTRTKRFTKVASPESYMVDVGKMSDSELIHELKQLGVSPGPITSSTREVYRRKLAKLKAEKTRGVVQSSSVTTVASESDEFSSSDEATDATEPPPQVKRPPASPYRLRSHHPIVQQTKRVVTPKKPSQPPVKQEMVAKPASPPLFESGGVWSWVVWLFWLLLTMVIAFVAGYVAFDMYLRGWGDSHVVSFITPYLPKTTPAATVTPEKN